MPRSNIKINVNIPKLSLNIIHLPAANRSTIPSPGRVAGERKYGEYRAMRRPRPSISETQPRPGKGVTAARLHLPRTGAARPDLRRADPGRSLPRRPGAACPTGPLTSSPCVDGHFFRRRPQLSRFPVCRCRVLARARSAPAARLLVPMAATARAATGPWEGGRMGDCPAGRCVRGPRGQREAAGPTRLQPGLHSGGGGRAPAEQRSGGSERSATGSAPRES